MAGHMQLRGRWVVVTGASSGLGRAMAEVLARDHGANLVLTARRAERLEALADALRTGHGVDVACCPADLTVPAEVDRLFEESTRDRAVHAVVLNAGVTYYGRHLELPLAELRAILATNVTAVAHLAGLFLPYLLQKDEGGGVLFVSSLGGSVPMPFQAAYGGTKAFVTHLGLDLREELRGRNVSLTVFAPGGIATEMVEKSGLSKKYPADSPWLMPVDRCARLAVRALIKRKAYVVPGLFNKLGALLQRILPRAVMMRMMANAYRME